MLLQERNKRETERERGEIGPICFTSPTCYHNMCVCVYVCVCVCVGSYEHRAVTIHGAQNQGPYGVPLAFLSNGKEGQF